MRTYTCSPKGFRQFLSEFPIFLKKIAALKFQTKRSDYYAYNSVPSVESIRLMTIILGKWDKTEEGQNAQLLLNYLRYRDSNQILIYLDCNRIKGSFD